MGEEQRGSVVTNKMKRTLGPALLLTLAPVIKGGVSVTFCCCKLTPIGVMYFLQQARTS